MIRFTIRLLTQDGSSPYLSRAFQMTENSQLGPPPRRALHVRGAGVGPFVPDFLKEPSV
jgi:hypothetical protein